MGVTVRPSTLPGGYTPVCNECGASAAYDISDFDYMEAMAQWDEWRCDYCTPMPLQMVEVAAGEAMDATYWCAGRNQGAILRDAGHPYTGEPGYDVMHLRARHAADLDRFIASATGRHWQVWMRFTHAHNALLFKPRGAASAWVDPVSASRR